jgi:S1-C subfamily serine protease
VLKIDPEAAGGRVQALKLAGAGDVNVGDTALAIGNPFGLERTATAGIVSATGRQIEAPNGFSISGAIQTDAPINPGNSGGPLLDGEGRVLGVNSQILTGGRGANGNVGIGFAVPSTTVADVAPRVTAGRMITRPYLGVPRRAAPEATAR